MDKTRPPSLINLVIIAALIFAGLYYAIIALSTEDPLWFLPTFEEFPEEIVMNCYGTVTSLRPGDEHYDALVGLVNETLSTSKNYDGLTMSDETYTYYLTDSTVMVLELIYTQKVRIHSTYKFFGNLDSIVIPLDGRHSNTNAIFGRSNGLSTAGALHYLALPDIRAYLGTSGLCQAP